MSTPDPDAPEDLFVTTQQAARVLGVSVRTVQLWVESGVLHAWKTAGGHRRIARASVEELQDQQREVIETVSGLNVLKVIVIEENPAYRELYRLKIEGWKLAVVVTTAANGFEGLMAAGKSSPDVVITELGLEGMNGFDMIRAMRAGLPKAEIVALTSLDEAAIEAAGGLPERVAVLENPVSFDELEALLRGTVVARRRG